MKTKEFYAINDLLCNIEKYKRNTVSITVTNVTESAKYVMFDGNGRVGDHYLYYRMYIVFVLSPAGHLCLKLHHVMITGDVTDNQRKVYKQLVRDCFHFCIPTRLI